MSSPVPADDRQHLAQEGDTLWSLAQSFYGKPELWKLIWHANTSLPPFHKPLRPGIRLVIPGATSLDERLAISARTRINDQRSKFHSYTPTRSTAQLDAEIPFLIPPLPHNVQLGTGSITVEASHLYSPTSTAAMEGVIEHGPFRLGWAPGSLASADSEADLKAVITVSEDALWQSDQESRRSLRHHFAAFCAQMEAWELEDRLLVPGASGLLRQRLAEAVPVPLVDTLFLRYGFNPGFGQDSSPYADLLPGMRLRLELAGHQFVSPGSPLNGMVATGQATYAVVRNPDGRIALDAFLGAIAGPEIEGSGRIMSAGGMVDLHAAGTARRHWRLFYPNQMAASSSPGASDIAANAILVGADTLADLLAATEAYTSSGDQATAQPGQAPILAFTLRGRAIAVPEIPVYISRRIAQIDRQETMTVSLGTTVRQLMERLVPAWNPFDPDMRSPKNLRLWRTWGVMEYREVVFSGDGPLLPDPAVFDLPLAVGDQISLVERI